MFWLLPQIKFLIANSHTAKYLPVLRLKKPNHFDLFTSCFGFFVTFYKINKKMFFIIMSTLKDEKVHFKWLYEENLKLEMDFKGSPPILASVLLCWWHGKKIQSCHLCFIVESIEYIYLEMHRCQNVGRSLKIHF